MTLSTRVRRPSLIAFALVVLMFAAPRLSNLHAAKAEDQAAKPAASGQANRAATTAQQAAKAATSPARPKLVVILVVDQLRADYVVKFGSHWTGGLKRLMTEGAWFRESAYPYQNTVTCAGHSTIATGALPHSHGIVSNSWYDRESGRSVPCVSDPEMSLVSYGQPPKTTGGTSTKNLRLPTLSDELRAQLPTPPRIVTFSRKDYTATTMAGGRSDATAWFDGGLASWMTSSAFTKEPVPFLAQYLKTHPVEADFGKTWTKLLPESAYQYEDDGFAEDTDVWGRTFPHVLKGKGETPDASFYARWSASPFLDAYLGAMAQHAVDALKLGQGAGTDFLSVSFSALDSVGHDFGPRSHEVQDLLARLDHTVGSLLAHLDKRVGRANYVLALTADHGASPIPEQMAARGWPAGRFLINDLMARLEKALEPTLGQGKHVARLSGSEVYFVPGAWRKLIANPDGLRAAMDAIRSSPGIADVFVGEDLQNVNASADDRLRLAAALNYFPGRSGDLIVVPRPYWHGASSPTVSAGTGHGTPYDYDQRVPVFLYGYGIKAGEYMGPAGPQDIAPTLAFLCGITLPAADGTVLSEALTRRGGVN